MKDQVPKAEVLMSLIRWLAEGRFQIPNFQRKFVWKPQQINDLMRSIFCDYYIGSLLLWEGGDKQNFDSLSCEPISGYKGKGEERKYIVLDGQQRLSAMYYAFFAPEENLPDLKSRGFFFVHIDRFSKGEYQDAFEVLYAQQQQEEQYQNHCFPLSTFGEIRPIWSAWIDGYKEYWKRQEMEADEAGNVENSQQCRNYQHYGEQFRKAIEGTLFDYKVSFTELSKKIDVGKICSIFIEINRTGTVLGTFDLLNAILTPKEIYLKEMWGDVSPKLEFVKGSRFNTYIPRVMSIILQQGNCSPQYLYRLIPGGDRIEDKDDFIRRWHDSVDAFEESIRVLQDPREKFGVISAKFLPYPAMTPVFTALRIVASDADPYERIAAFRKVRHWYWASVFTERYSSSVESKTASDFRDVLAWIGGNTEPDMIREFHNTVGHRDLRGVRSKAIYKGIINLLVLRGSFDWISGHAPIPAKIDDHHIIPQWWGNREGLGDSIHTILNRTLLSEETNRNIIGGSLPNEYLPKLMEQDEPDKVRKILESHFISHEAFNILLEKPFTRDHFAQFTAVRQETIRNAIGPLLFEEHLDLDPDLRTMDEAIEKIELALRACIERAVDVDEIKGLHFYPKVQVLVDATMRNPAHDRDYYNTIAGKLEHFDLREIEDTIKSRQIWDRFADRFGTKEGLSMRFGQLGELRNAIRHSRTADEVTRRDGQAAIAWFRAALELEN